MHWDILNQKRKDVLPKLSFVKELNFYLAGGTGLALILGHRDSIDFDFFCQNEINTEKLFKKIQEVFDGHAIVKTQEEKNTLSVVVDDDINLSFMTFNYPLIDDLIETEFFGVASINDIAVMKLNAITGRSVLKDYVDLYFILKENDLAEIFKLTLQKMPTLDLIFILKSLVYFDDIKIEPINFKKTRVDFDEIKKSMIEKVGNYNKNNLLKI
jgi:hypothetical protein